MSNNPQAKAKPSRGAGFAWRLAAFYAALFVALGVQLPFLPVWFAAQGLDAGAIGIALAIPQVVRVFSIPLATRNADRRDALRGALMIAAAAPRSATAPSVWRRARSPSWPRSRSPRPSTRRSCR